MGQHRCDRRLQVDGAAGALTLTLTLTLTLSLSLTERQVHREVVVFDSRQVYPEYVVYYRLDTEEEEEELRLAYEAKQAAARDKMLAAALSFASNGSPTAAMAAMLAASCVGLTGTARCRRERYAACCMMMAAAEMNFAAAQSALPLLEFSDDDDDDSDE